MPPFLFAANPTAEKQQLLNKSNIADLKKCKNRKEWRRMAQDFVQVCAQWREILTKFHKHPENLKISEIFSIIILEK